MLTAAHIKALCQRGNKFEEYNVHTTWLLEKWAIFMFEYILPAEVIITCVYWGILFNGFDDNHPEWIEIC